MRRLMTLQCCFDVEYPVDFVFGKNRLEARRSVCDLKRNCDRMSEK